MYISHEGIFINYLSVNNKNIIINVYIKKNQVLHGMHFVTVTYKIVSPVLNTRYN